MIGLLVVGAIGVIGWGSPAKCNPKCLTLMQSGSVTIQLTNALSGSSTVTFNPAYSTNPQVSLLQVGGSVVSVEYQTSSMTFLSIETAGQVWGAMPAASTEIFNDQTHEIYADLTRANQAILEVNCPVAAANVGGETLNVEYSLDGTTWNGLALNGPATSQIFLDGANVLGNCQIGPFPAVSSLFDLASAARTQVFLRIVGAGGDGLFDAPSFTEIHLLVYSLVGVPCTAGVLVIPSATSMSIRINCAAPITASFTVRWFAGLPA